MRELSAKQNVIEIQDPVSGDVHEFHYRLPTNQERIEFQNRMIQRKGGKVMVRRDFFSLHVEYGALVLSGFKPGTLSVDKKIISADPEGPDYYENWKDLLLEVAPDMLAVIGRAVFSGAQVAGSDEAFEIAEDDEVPLAG